MYGYKLPTMDNELLTKDSKLRAKALESVNQRERVRRVELSGESRGDSLQRAFIRGAQRVVPPNHRRQEGLRSIAQQRLRWKPVQHVLL